MGKNIKFPRIDSYLNLGLFLFIFKTMISATKIDVLFPQIDNILTCLIVFFLSIVIFKKKFTLKILCIHILLVLFGMSTSYFCKNIAIFIPLITIFAIREERNIIYLMMKYEICVLILIFIYALYNNNLFWYDYKSSRYFLNAGFNHPNFLGCVVYNILLMWIWCNYGKLTKKVLRLICCLFIITFLLTGSKTVFLIGLIVATLIYSSYSEKLYVKKILHYTAKFIIPTLSVIFYLLITKYNEANIVVSTINKLLTGRVKLAAYANYQYGLTFLGQFVDGTKSFGWNETWQMSHFGTFDNLYTCMLINYGIIWLIIISVAFYYLSRKENNLINCMLISWALYGVTEIQGMSGFLGFPIFFAAILIERKSYLKPEMDF